MEVLPGIFNMTSYVCMCKSYCFLSLSLVFWAFLFPNTVKIVFDDLEKLIFRFWGSKLKGQ